MREKCKHIWSEHPLLLDIDCMRCGKGHISAFIRTFFNLITLGFLAELWCYSKPQPNSLVQAIKNRKKELRRTNPYRRNRYNRPDEPKEITKTIKQ